MKSLNTKEFRETIMRQFKNNKVPVMGTFELTGRCNFDCKMCYIHTKSNADFLKTERNGDWWISIIEEACKHGMLFALITGGECLLHPDFRRIYTYLRSKGVFTSINTNGYLLNQELIGFLKQSPPFELQITLYGTSDESYYYVTGVRAFSRVRDGILRAKDAGLNVKVAVTPNPYAPGETVRIVEYLKELSIPISINEVLQTSYDDGSKQVLSDYQVDIEEKILYLSETEDTAPQSISLDLLPSVGGGETTPIVGLKCSGGKTAFLITHDGYMLPCTRGRDISIPILGAEDFEGAWESVQNNVAKFLQPIECEGCVYKKVCLPCPILRCGKVGNGHCDSNVCEMTQKLVAAGVKKLTMELREPGECG